MRAVLQEKALFEAREVSSFLRFVLARRLSSFGWNGLKQNNKPHVLFYITTIIGLLMQTARTHPRLASLQLHVSALIDHLFILLVI